MSVQAAIPAKRFTRAASAAARLAVVCDFREENWPSMELVADMLLQNLREDFGERVLAERIQPPMKQAFSRVSASSMARNTDRLMGRLRQYPRFLRTMPNQYDLYHVVDHSYAHLVHDLPAKKTVVTCHDLDTFRCLLQPESEKRSFAFRRMTARILDGLKKSAWIACASAATRNALIEYEIVRADRVSVVHNGVHPAYGPLPNPMSDAEAAGLLGRRVGQKLEIIHVGSSIRRKRIDVLLRVFAGIREHLPNVRLVRVGEEFTAEQLEIVRELKLEDAIDVIPLASPRTLAALYRRAALLLQTSDAEGFGLPVAEAMACGTPVVASAIPALLEIGADAAEFCAVGAVEEWVSTACQVISERSNETQRRARKDRLLQNAARFSWKEYSLQMMEIYDKVLVS